MSKCEAVCASMRVHAAVCVGAGVQWSVEPFEEEGGGCARKPALRSHLLSVNF